MLLSMEHRLEELTAMLASAQRCLEAASTKADDNGVMRWKACASKLETMLITERKHYPY